MGCVSGILIGTFLLKPLTDQLKKVSAIGTKLIIFLFWGKFKVVEGHGSPRGMDGKFSNGVRNLLPGYFPGDF